MGTAVVDMSWVLRIRLTGAAVLQFMIFILIVRIRKEDSYREL